MEKLRREGTASRNCRLLGSLWAVDFDLISTLETCQSGSPLNLNNESSIDFGFALS